MTRQRPRDAVASTSLRRETLWSLCGSIAQSSQSFLLIYLLSRFTTTQEVGHFALAMAIVVPFHLFADRTIRTLQATNDRLAASIGDLLSFRWLLACTATAILMVGTACWQLDLHLLITLALVSGHRTVEGFAQVLYGPLHRASQLRSIGVSLVLRATVTIFAAIIALATGGHLHEALAAALVGQAAVISLFDIRVSRQIHFVDGRSPELGSSHARPLTIHVRRIPWRPLLASSLPLAMTTFLVAASAGIPRLVLCEFAGEDRVAALTMAGFLSFPASVAAASVMQAALPRMSRWRRDAADRSHRLLLHLLVTCGVLGILNFLTVCIAGSWLNTRLFGPQYEVEWITIAWLTAATSVGFLSAVPATFLTAQKHYRIAAASCLLTFGVCLVASLLLIPKMTLLGAAVATWITNLTHGIVAGISWWRIQNKPPLADAEAT